MSLHLVIDGYNLIGVNAGLNDIEAQRETLIGSLAAYKRLKRVKVTVVFDGTRSKRLTGSKETRSGVEVIFSRDGQEADEVIKNFARTKGEGLTIVTSDRDVSSYARAHRAVVVSSNEFRDLLDMALYEDLKGVSPEDEENGQHDKKGPSKRPPKSERKKMNRLKKL